MSTIHTKPLTSSPTSSTLSSKISSRDPSALNATPVIKEKNALSAQSISPKAKINPRELFSRLINLSSAKSILQHIESLTSQLAASKNLQVFEDLLQDGQYSKSFQHALHKGLPHPASPVGRENLKECLASLNKINEQSAAHKKLARYLQNALIDHVADQFLKALHTSNDSLPTMSSYEQLNQIMKRKNFDSSENLWTELRKEIAIKQPNFDFEAHKAILLMCEASARNLQD